GGKITTYRHLAEDALEKMSDILPETRTGAWTRGAVLPGGDFPVTGVDGQIAALLHACPVLDRTHAARLVRAYGTLAREIFNGVNEIGDLGRHFGAGLFEREVVYLMDREWARTADDIVWRRSKLGLRMNTDQIEELDRWMRGRISTDNLLAQSKTSTIARPGPPT
ncbi:MAG TPA: glycerol-3-phosphate dehydrogenase, partial [Rhizobiales bacterium]|nr:glycerol-3-phosphate dehydrogenase [Hyphomicrobiales bacterium]